MFTNPVSLAQAGQRASETLGAHNIQTDDPPSTSEPTTSERDAEIVSIARQISNFGDAEDVSNRLFRYEKDSPLDPFGEAFDARLWVRLMSRVSRDAGGQKLSGLSYRDLCVHGYGSDADYQSTVASMPLGWLTALRDMVVRTNRQRKIQILNGFDGVLEAGEMLVVLGPPGSGCSTFLKTIAQEMNGIYLDSGSKLNYRGITPEQMSGQFRGEAIYTAEVDEHFPKLTVGKTLSFAAEARAPRHPPGGLTQQQYADHYRNTMMALFGISHTINTIVGNDFIRGVSGGERKRVTICEAALSGAPLQCWDNSTRGLDSANAIEFVRNLRLSAEYLGTTSAVAIYQAPQSAYDLFDKVSVLYDGEQIFFGKTTEAKAFFEEMGFECPEQQTTPDFLTSLTSPAERKARKGCEGSVPQTPKEFASRWKASKEYRRLVNEIEAFERRHPVNGERYDEFLASRRMVQSKHVAASSPYTLSYWSQVRLCLKRGFWRLVADPGFTLSQLIGNSCMALIIGSLFFQLEPTTAQFFSRGALIFFAVLLNAFSSALEIYTLYAQRGIVDKHARYAFYHRSAEAFASMLTDMPYKVSNAILFNTILYFMAGLRREAGPYFFFVLFNFFICLVMSNIFRSMAALSRTLEQALAPACVLILGIVMFTGFAIPVDYMPGWCRWMNYIDPVAFGFESLMINEFSGREFACASVVPSGPGYEGVTGEARVCSAVGSVPGSLLVSGDAFIEQSYQYYAAHRWRNFGILWAFFLGIGAVYVIATEYISAKRSKGEVLVFPKGKVPKDLKATRPDDAESQLPNRSSGPEGSREVANIPPQTAIFSWRDVVYDIKIKKEPRRILDHVDGWVKPGTLTALMGVSGAGKTTLLDVLATRTTMGVITGEILVDGRQRDNSFQRKTGYVQQQDLHLPTSTVREALTFSALLRQPRHVPKQEKLEYVDEVLKLLEMDAYADAVVGVPGEGLNVEQRKRLTIGVELVAKPGLLLFLDEPTSGLDSQTSWNILQLLRKLTAHGQAILCTIHQPSAILFENFDRLLFLARGGKTVYFGEVGARSHILIDYFERNGASKCPSGENPAEWMLSAIGAAPGSKTDVDWHRVWLDSPERAAVREHLDEIKVNRGSGDQEKANDAGEDATAYAEFAAPFGTQLRVVTQRVFQQYWRTPTYIYSKAALCVFSALYIGFVFFKSSSTQQGMQNQMLSIFLLFLIFAQMIGQILPNYVIQRSLYEVRERPSKTFSWKVHVLTSMLAEVPWNALMGTLVFLTWYYPIGLYRNAEWTDTTAERGALTWLYIQEFMLWMSTFGQACIAMFDDPEVAAEVANLLIMMCLFFCGILVTGAAMPGFWKFMWRVSPLTYLVEGLLTAGLARAPAECDQSELLELVPPQGTCGEYLEAYMSQAGGYLVDRDATETCQYCPIDNTDQYLELLGLSYSNRWRDFGLLWVFIVFNVIVAVGLYWLARVPKNKRKEQAGPAAEGGEKKWRA